jgi:ABC transport system ATP-binding/permease protein
VALARTLVAECDLLILDEPTNHLDIDASPGSRTGSPAIGGGMVLVSHDRHLLDRVTTRILELDRGKGHVHEGGYDATSRQGRARGAGRQGRGRSRRNLARQELAWLRRGAPGAHPQAQGAHRAATAVVEGKAQAAARSGDLDLHFGDAPPRRQGHRAARCRAPPRRPVAVPQRRPAARPSATGSASSGSTAPASRPCSTSSPDGRAA